MRTQIYLIWIFMFAGLAVMGGCATHMNLQNVMLIPPPAGTSETLRAQSVLIRAVTDERTVDGRVLGPREIGRLPEGAAVSEIELSANETVEALIRQTITNELTGMGYHIEKDEGMISSNDIVLDVSIKKFWGEVGGGGEQYPNSHEKFMNGGIITSVEVSGPIGKKQSIQIKAESGRNIHPRSEERDWKELFQALLDAYGRNAKSGFKDLQQP